MKRSNTNSNKFTNIAYFKKIYPKTNNFLSTTTVSTRACTIVYNRKDALGCVISDVNIGFIDCSGSFNMYSFIEGRWKFIGSFHLLKFNSDFFFSIRSWSGRELFTWSRYFLSADNFLIFMLQMTQCVLYGTVYVIFFTGTFASLILDVLECPEFLCTYFWVNRLKKKKNH